jgi:cell division protein FtsI/penicillin-binding protein 2
MVKTRIKLLSFVFYLVGFLILSRLFYWQFIASDRLAAQGESQRLISLEIPAKRGRILASDGFPLVDNQRSFLIYASIKDIIDDADKIATKLAPFLVKESAGVEIATPSAAQELKKEELKKTEETTKSRLKRVDLTWVPLKHKVKKETKEKIESLELKGIGFEPEDERFYPEGTSSAHLLGFVGKDINSEDRGYFGLEGYYDRELRGRKGTVKLEKDAAGRPILVGLEKEEKGRNGRDILTTIDRGVQYIVESHLEKGVQKYGAKSGSVVILNPKTGAVISLASYPGYDPQKYSDYEKGECKNPVVAESFEPGSIFKILVMAAALEEKAVNPDSLCTACNGPLKIAEYTIETWNQKYHPNCTMTEVIQNSDNVGMVFVGQKLGVEKLYHYLEKFGLGEKTKIDLEEETDPPLRSFRNWSTVDLATIAFGQGIAITPIQMITAASAIANKGSLMQPYIVQKIIGQNEATISPKKIRTVLSEETAKEITQMMVNAVEEGEAKWSKPKDYQIAGKTGTAQIPIKGHYDTEKTITSFIGFVPPDNPRFIMLVTLREPTSSPWGSETAAPLFFDIAKELFTYFGIPPS